MQAIETKYIGPSYAKPARVVATCQAKRRIYSYDQLQNQLQEQGRTLGLDEVTMLAAEKLAMELGWNTSHYGRMVMGTLKNGNNVFVFTGKE